MFCSKEALKRHTNNIHLNLKDKLCPHCDYKTHVNFNLRIHIMRVHEGKQFKVQCQYCNKNVNSLDWHVKTYHRQEYDALNSSAPVNPVQIHWIGDEM